jgi:hydrogenase maturation protease
VPLVIGIGREGHGDDDAGVRAARLVRALLWPHVRMTECAGDAAALLEGWRGEQAVILVDAMSSGAPAGSIRRLDVTGAPIPAVFFRDSTHALGLTEAVELGRSLGRLPEALILYGIEGRDFAPGGRLSYPVECAVRDAALMISEEIITRWGVHPPPADAVP